MIRDADRDGARFTDIDDLRITRIGKIIRVLRIDEVPQLFNILFGTMSLIGPRPEQKAFVDKLEDEIPLYTFRHAVRPGITGWAQVMQGYADDVASTNTKLSFDLFYIKNISLMMDTVDIYQNPENNFHRFWCKIGLLPLAHFHLKTAAMQNRLSIARRLGTAVKHQITRSLERDRMIEICGHWLIFWVVFILQIDDFSHSPHRYHHLVTSDNIVMKPVGDML